MISSKLLIGILSIAAVPTQHVNETLREITTSITKLKQLQSEGIENIDQFGWRKRMKDDGDLRALRSLSIVQVGSLKVLMNRFIKPGNLSQSNDPLVYTANFGHHASNFWNGCIVGRTTGRQSL